jgi:hypothetical protein
MSTAACNEWQRVPVDRLDSSSVRSRFQVEIGEKYLRLVTACLEWRREINIYLLSTETLHAALHTKNFLTICSIHADLKEKSNRDSVAEFLLELVDGGYGPGFLIAYAYLVRSVPKEYNRLSLSRLGNASELMNVLSAVGC